MENRRKRAKASILATLACESGRRDLTVRSFVLVLTCSLLLAPRGVASSSYPIRSSSSSSSRMSSFPPSSSSFSSDVEPVAVAAAGNPQARKFDGGFLAKLFSTVIRGIGRYSSFPFGCKCDRFYEPVCGTDGLTYPNRCYLHCRRTSLTGPGAHTARMISETSKATARDSSSRSDKRSGDGEAEERTLKFIQELGPGGSLECGLLPDGSDYAGHMEFSRTGRRCARWDTHRDTYPITPEHPFSPIQDYNFPEQSITAARNFCRNPDRDKRGPWCFTGSPQETYNFDFCEVPRCGQFGTIPGFGVHGGGHGFEHGMMGPMLPGEAGGDFGGFPPPGYGQHGFGGYGHVGISLAHEGPCKNLDMFPPYDQHHYSHRRLELEDGGLQGGDTSSTGSANRVKPAAEPQCRNSPKYVYECDAWAKEGQCYANYKFMKANCPKSCFFSICQASDRSPDEPANERAVRFPK